MKMDTSVISMLTNRTGFSLSPTAISVAVREEIQRFESVHPNIYALHEIIDSLKSQEVQQRLREHLFAIEDAFVNSQEWTLSRTIQELKLGVLGTSNSGKSSLVHHYLTGEFLNEETFEGGRFKKEVTQSEKSCLLLIREEGGPPDAQFSQWVDAVVFVFNATIESSFNSIYTYYAKLSLHRHLSHVPLILVASLDGVSEKNPRKISEMKGRKLASELKNCFYFEVSSVYGINVNTVFNEACSKIMESKNRLVSLSSSSSPSISPLNNPPPLQNQPMARQPSLDSQTKLLRNNQINNYFNTSINTKSVITGNNKNKNFLSNRSSLDNTSSSTSTCVSFNKHNSVHSPNIDNIHSNDNCVSNNISINKFNSININNNKKNIVNNDKTFQNNKKIIASIDNNCNKTSFVLANNTDNNNDIKYNSNHIDTSCTSLINNNNNNNYNNNYNNNGININLLKSSSIKNMSDDREDKIDSFFAKEKNIQHTRSCNYNNSGHGNNSTNKCDNSFQNELSSNRSFSTQSINQGEEEASLTTPNTTPTPLRKNIRRRSNIFTSKKEAEERRIKISETPLGIGRVIPIKQGWIYKKSNKTLSKDWIKKYITLFGDGRLIYYPSLHDYMENIHGKEINLSQVTIKIPGLGPKGSEPCRNSSNQRSSGISLNSGNPMNESLVVSNAGSVCISPSGSSTNVSGLAGKIETPNTKRKHKRVKSHSKSLEGTEGYEFTIVSLDNKQWTFEVSSYEERSDWVLSIEQQILSSLQNHPSSKVTIFKNANSSIIRSIKLVPGNEMCADCQAKNPEWASLNLGALICIECCGIHRNLGSHMSRVRSLELDDWPGNYVDVMISVGNQLANSVWEGICEGYKKPSSDSPREEKDKWIRMKYDQKCFLPHLPFEGIPIQQQLMDAVACNNVSNLILVLAHCTPEDVNTPYNNTNDTRTALHIAAAFGKIVLVQLLLWYGANPDQLDHENNTPAFYAKEHKAFDCLKIIEARNF